MLGLFETIEGSQASAHKFSEEYLNHTPIYHFLLENEVGYFGMSNTFNLPHVFGYTYYSCLL